MKTLEELFAAWENGSLSDDDVAELKRLLAKPEARADLVGDWLLHGAVYECLREERAAQELAKQAEREGAGLTAPFWHWLALAATLVMAGLVGWQALRAHSSDRARDAVTHRGSVPAPRPETRSVAGVLIATQGEVWVTMAGQTNASQVAGIDLTLHTGDAIRTGSNGLGRFTYPDGSALVIYHGSRLVVGCTNAALRLEVKAGAVDADIRPQPAGQDMLATTTFMQSDIIGTEFRLMVDSRSAWLGVRKGKVEVTRVSDGQKILLGQANYAAVHPEWPYMRMNPLVCPVWKAVCQRAAGSAYP